MKSNIICKLGLHLPKIIYFLIALYISPASAAGVTKLGDIVASANSGTAPNGYFYVTLTASPDNGAHIPELQCVNKSFWAFARRFIGITKSASAMLTATITPTNEPAQAITIPIFVTSVIEDRGSGSGSTCQTKFWARPITFTFNSNLNPKFNIDLAFHFSNSTDSVAMANFVSDAQNLMSLVGKASATPSALAVKLADPQIKALASGIDAQIRNNWTNSNDLQVSKQLTTGSDGGPIVDVITFKMPVTSDDSDGPVLKDWDAGGTISLIYGHEKFKSGGQWIDSDSILVMPIIPSDAPGAEKTLDRIVLNGDATNGFDKLSLITASNQSSLSEACSHLKRFLASFLIPNDALVARYALLKESSYDKNPDLREDSGCLTNKEISDLTSMRDDYIFSDRPREERDNATIESRMQASRPALLSMNSELIKTVVVNPSSKFYVVLGQSKNDYFIGDMAIAKLSESRIKFGCYQARPNHDLSSIAAVALYDGHKTGAIVSFDDANKLSSIVLMPPDAVADSLSIDMAKWLNASNPNCAVDRPAT